MPISHYRTISLMGLGAILLTFLTYCSEMKNGSNQLKQGVTGRVLWLSGNLMPGPGSKPSQGKPIEREILFYAPVKMQDLSSANGLYKSVPTALEATVRSDEEGQFSVSLPVGQYSVFVKEPEGYFANSFNGDGFVNLVTVAQDSISEMTIKVNYRAVY